MERCELDAVHNRQDYLRHNLDMQFCIHYFHQNDLIDEDQKETIMAEIIKAKQVDMFLGYLYKNKKPGLFAILCRSLIESSNEFIAEDLQIELQRIRNNPNLLHPEDWLQRLTPEGRKRMVSASELVLVSDFVGSGWQDLATSMGFHKAKIQQIQMQYPHSINQQISAMLQTWKTNQGKRATVEKFVHVCRQVAALDQDAIRDVLLDHANEIQSQTKPVLL